MAEMLNTTKTDKKEEEAKKISCLGVRQLA